MKPRDRQIEAAEAELEFALKNFRQSVHAWSDAEFARSRSVAFSAHRLSWRRASAWALGCVLAAGSLSAGFFVHHRQQVREQLAYLAAQRRAEQRQLAAQQAAAAQRDEDAKLMAAVDKDVAQEVPSAMEPLAQLMDESSSQ